MLLLIVTQASLVILAEVNFDDCGFLGEVFSFELFYTIQD